MSWFRNYISCLTGLTILVVLTVLFILCLPREGCAAYYWPTNVPRWTRTGSWYEVKHDGQTLQSVANHLLADGTAQDKWLYGQELVAIRRVPAATIIPRGSQVRVGCYHRYHGPASRYHTVGMREYHLCVMAGMRYGVRPSLLVGVRLHEGGNRYPAWSPWGCKPHGKYTLRQEAFLAAKIVRRHANRVGWNAWNPTRAQLQRLGGYYTTGRWSAVNTHWGNCVHAIMHRAEGE